MRQAVHGQGTPRQGGSMCVHCMLKTVLRKVLRCHTPAQKNEAGLWHRRYAQRGELVMQEFLWPHAKRENVRTGDLEAGPSEQQVQHTRGMSGILLPSTGRPRPHLWASVGSVGGILWHTTLVFC